MNDNKKYLDRFYWYDMSNDDLIAKIPDAAINPDYPSNFQTQFGMIPVTFMKVIDKILPLNKFKGFEKLLMDNGFDLLEASSSSFKYAHFDRKIIMYGDITLPKNDIDNEDDESDPEDEYPMLSGESLYISVLPTVENRKFMESIMKKLPRFFLDISKQEDKFYMIAQNQKGLYTQKTRFKSIPIKDDRYDMFYGEKFPHEMMMKFIGEETEHLLLLHGDPGTGKSNYIKHMITNAKKKVIYIPPSMLSVISSPGFVSFMMENKDSILLIEDAEEVLSVDRNSATNNLLGLTDGFLKDALNLKIIATFNCNIGKIDPALMRKGRMYFEYKFDKLSVNECVKLSQFVGFDREINEPMTLAEFFNIDDNHADNSLEQRRIGFQ